MVKIIQYKNQNNTLYEPNISKIVFSAEKFDII
jgi:hypothetical protein